MIDVMGLKRPRQNGVQRRSPRIARRQRRMRTALLTAGARQFASRGVARVSVEDLLAEAAEKGRAVRLKVVLTNPARRLYARLGFIGLGNDGVYEQMEWRSDSEESNVKKTHL